MLYRLDQNPAYFFALGDLATAASRLATLASATARGPARTTADSRHRVLILLHHGAHLLPLRIRGGRLLLHHHLPQAFQGQLQLRLIQGIAAVRVVLSEQRLGELFDGRHVLLPHHVATHPVATLGIPIRHACCLLNAIVRVGGTTLLSPLLLRPASNRQ